MGDWHHPEHFSDDAKAFEVESRRRSVAHFVETVLPHMRTVARMLGYTIAVHGSLARDLDLIAVPWTEEAKDPESLVTALCAEIKRRTGWGNGPKKGDYTQKPHGRIAMTIVATWHMHIDLSIMPRTPPPPIGEDLDD